MERPKGWPALTSDPVQLNETIVYWLDHRYESIYLEFGWLKDIVVWNSNRVESLPYQLSFNLEERAREEGALEEYSGHLIMSIMEKVLTTDMDLVTIAQRFGRHVIMFYEIQDFLLKEF